MWNTETLQASVRDGRIEWRRHILERMAERGLSQACVVGILLAGEKIRDYSDDKPFASALFLGYLAGRPLHVMAAFDEATGLVFIITVYEPSLDVFESDYKTRRKS